MKCFVALLMVSSAFAADLNPDAAKSAVPEQTAIITDAETGEPVADCYVYTEGQSIIAETGAAGTFDLEPFRKARQLFFFHAGYARLTLTLSELEQREYAVRLTPIRYTAEEVVVEGHRFGNERAQIAQQVEEVAAKDIEFENPRTAAEVIENGGVFVQRSQFGGGSPTLRGYTANSVLLVMDGVRMNNAIYRAGNLQNSITVDGSALGSADILFGPGSVQYGSDAMGGVMVFNTADPLPSLTRSADVHARGFTRYATADAEKTAGVTAELGLQKWAFLGAFTYSDFGDLRTGRVRSLAYPDYGRRTEYVERQNGQDVIVHNDNSSVQTPSGYTQANLLGKARYWFNPHWNATYALLYTTGSDIPRYDRLEQYRNGELRYAEWYYGPQKWLMNRLTVHGAEGGALYDEATFTAAHQGYQESRHDRSLSSDVKNHRTEDVGMVSVTADLGRNLGRGRLFYGAEADFNQVASSAHTENVDTGETGPLSTRYPDGGSHTTTLALYGGWRVPLARDVIATAGARYTHNLLTSKFENKSFFAFPFDEITYNSGAPTASLGAVYSPGAWQMRGVLSSGFRAPNVDDVGKIFDSGDGIVIFPNPELSSEYSYNAELGVQRTLAERITLGGTGYYSRLVDAVVVGDAQFNGQDSILYDGTMSKVKSLQNAGDAYLTGFDFFAKANLSPALSASTRLSYGAGHDQQNDLPMRAVPPLYGQTSVLYETRVWTGELFARYNGWKQEEDIPLSGGEVSVYTPDGVPSWWTLNVRGSVRIVQPLECVAALENIFDLHYRPYGSGISAPGRNFIVSLRTEL